MKFRKNSNLLADFIVRFNGGVNRGTEFIFVPYSSTLFDIVSLMYLYGCLKSFSVVTDVETSLLYIKIYPSYILGGSLVKGLTIVSKPGLRVFWTLNDLALQYSKKNIQGFFIISTSKGVCSSNELLMTASFRSAVAGEVLLRVDF